MNNTGIFLQKFICTYLQIPHFLNLNYFDPVPRIDKNRLKLGMLIEIEIFEKVKIEPFPKFKYRYLQTQPNIFFSFTD